MALPPLAGTSDMAAYLQTSDGDLDLGQVLFYLRSASAFIRSYLQQTVTAVTDDVALVTPDYNLGTIELWLKELPITAVTKVEARTRVGNVTTWSNVDLTVVDIDADMGRLTLDTNDLTGTGTFGWSLGPSSWRVTYSHGYATGSVPDAIVTETVRMAARDFASPVGVKRETLSSYAVQYDETDGAAAVDVARLAPYRYKAMV